MINKILIIGCSGSGKKTLANTLHGALSLPVIHLDHHYWLPNWQQPNPAAWEEKINLLCQAKQWIMDGNYTQSLSMRIPHADFIIFLDTPRWLCMIRVLKRSLFFWQNKNRADLAPGCNEQFNINLLKWTWGFPKRSRKEILDLLGKIDSDKKTIIRSRNDRIRLIKRLLKPVLPY